MTTATVDADFHCEREILFAVAPVSAYVFDDLTLTFLEANNVTLELCGCSREEFLARSLEDIWMPEDRARLPDLLREPTNEKRRGTCRHITKSGQVFEAETVSQGIVHQGRAAHFVVATDIGLGTCPSEVVKPRISGAPDDCRRTADAHDFRSAGPERQDRRHVPSQNLQKK